MIEALLKILIRLSINADFDNSEIKADIFLSVTCFSIN